MSRPLGPGDLKASTTWLGYCILSIPGLCPGCYPHQVSCPAPLLLTSPVKDTESWCCTVRVQIPLWACQNRTV